MPRHACHRQKFRRAESRSGRDRRWRRLAIESLEARTMLAIAIWDGEGDAISWHDPLNWSDDIVPAAEDDAIIDFKSGENFRPTIEIAGSASVRSLQTNTSIRVTAGDVAIDEAFVLQPGFALEVSSATFRADADTVIDGASLLAHNGGSIALPTQTSYRLLRVAGSSPFRSPVFRASGVGSSLDLSQLVDIDIKGSHTSFEIEAIDGGRIDLSRVATIRETSDSFNSRINLLADGAGSLIDLPSLQRFLDRDGIHESPNAWSSSIARNGGMIRADQLTRLRGVRLVVDGSGAQSISQIAVMELGQLELGDGELHRFDEILDLKLSSLVITNGTDVDFPNADRIDSANILVEGGSRVSMPSVTSITHISADRGRTRTLRASGAGSILDLANVTNVRNGSNLGAEFHIEALDGGIVDLSRVSSITESEEGNPVQRAIHVLADGKASQVDLEALNKVVDSHPEGRAAGVSSSMAARNGGTIDAPGLTELRGTRLTIDGTGTQSVSQIRSFQLSELVVSGGTEYAFPLITDLAQSSITVNDDTTVRFDNVTSIDSANVTVEGGATLSFPAVDHIVHRLSDLGRTSSLRAIGANSQLNLSQVKSIRVAAEDVRLLSIKEAELVIETREGGRIDLQRTTSITESSPFSTTNWTRLVADGADSLLDLSSLTKFVDVDFRSSLRNPSSITARNGGTIVAPHLTELRGVHLEIDETGSLDWSQIKTFDRGRLSFKGGVHDVTAITDLTLSFVSAAEGAQVTFHNVKRFDSGQALVSGGATVSFPALTEITHFSRDAQILTSQLRAEDAGSLLDLRQVEMIHHGGANGTMLSIEAHDGARIDLSRTTTISETDDGLAGNRRMTVVADGAGSLVDLSSLTTFIDVGGQRDSSIVQRNGGAVIHDNLTYAPNVNIDLAGLAAVRAERVAESVRHEPPVFEPPPPALRRQVPAVAGIFKWIGGDGDWFDPNNWDRGVAPTEASDVVIDVSASDIVVTLDGQDVRIRSLQTTESLVITDAMLTVVDVSQLSGTLTVDDGATLVAEGSHARLLVDGSISLIDGNLLATAGGTVSLPTLSQLAWAGRTRSLQATGSSSLLDLPNLTELTFGSASGTLEIAALDGGRVELASTERILESGAKANTNAAVIIRAEGHDSTINLSSLRQFVDQDANLITRTWSSMAARDGGRIESGQLVELRRAHLAIDGSGDQAVSQITVFDQGIFEFVESGTQVLSNITDLSLSSINVRGHSDVTFMGVTRIDSVDIEVSEGGKLSFPSVLQMEHASTAVRSERRVRVLDHGSSLNLANVTTISATVVGAQWEFEAIRGGQIDLRQVRSIDIPDADDNRSRSIDMLANGEGSQIDLRSLTRFVDNFFDALSADALTGDWSTMSASFGGTIVADRLEELRGVNLVVDGSGDQSISQIKRFDRGRLELADGGTHSLSNLTDVTLSLIVVAGGTAAVFENVTQLISTHLTVSGRSTVSFPRTTSITHTLTHHSNRGSIRAFRVIGPGSILDLKNVQTVANLDADRAQVSFEAFAGGRIDLREATSIRTSEGAVRNDRSLDVIADGEDSFIDLRSLKEITDTSTLEVSGGRRTVVEARNGGTINAIQLAKLQGARLVLDGTGTLPVSQIEVTTHAQFELSGGSLYDLSNVTDLRAAVVDVAGDETSVMMEKVVNLDSASVVVRQGASVAFPSVTSIKHASPSLVSRPMFRAIGRGSRLDLSHVDTITNTIVPFAGLSFDSFAGGHIDLTNVRTIEDPAGDRTNGRAIDFNADGARSIIDLSSLQSFDDLSNDRLGRRSIFVAGHLGQIVIRASASRFEGVDLFIGQASQLNGSLLLGSDSLLAGAGRVTGRVTNFGKINPTGKLEIEGDFLQDIAGHLEIDINGTSQGEDFDWLAVTGIADLQGTLSVGPPTVFTPVDGDAFQVLTFADRIGGFNRFEGMERGGLASLYVDLSATTGTLVAGPPTPADPFESNDHAGEATILDSDEQVVDGLTIHRFDDQDWFRLRASAGGVLIVALESDSRYGDTDLAVMDEQQRAIAVSRSERNNERISFPVLPGDLLFFQVVGFANTIPDYTLVTQLLPDADGDGLPDDWETDGIDIDADGRVDYSLAAADPRHKDIYIEIDSMAGRAPLPLSTPIPSVVDAGLNTNTVLDRVVAEFLRAPVTNPDGSRGIRLHLMVDESNLPLATFERWSDFVDIRNGIDGGSSGHFGTAAERQSANATTTLAAKTAVYRYALLADRIGHRRTSGIAESPGTNFAITLGAWNVPGGTADEQAGTFMHELGHSLGLRHGGNEDVNFKPNYLSVMNYHWQVPLPRKNNGWKLGYSDGTGPTLDELLLNENLGVGFSLDGGFDDRQLQIGPSPFQSISLVGAVDWNRNGQIDALPVAVDVNRGFADSNRDGFVNNDDAGELGQRLRDHDDWSALQFVFTGPADLRKYRDGVTVLPWKEDDFDPSDMYDDAPADWFDEHPDRDNDTREMAFCLDDLEHSSAAQFGQDELAGATIHDSDDTDWYKLLVPFPGILSVVFSTTFAAIGQALEVQISDSSNRVLSSSERRSGDAPVRLDIDVGSAQTYYLRVTGNRGARGIYHVDFDVRPARDAAFLAEICAAIAADEMRGDLDGNGVVDLNDWHHAVHDVMQTVFGDANLDGIFNSSDLVAVFQAGEYEDESGGNSSWSTGDWNCDGEFDSSDLVAAFQQGAYDPSAAKPRRNSAN